ncbi:MAG: T9SS C-terminal target domain-containing protein, partial [Ignavibacteria bacterium]
VDTVFFHHDSTLRNCASKYLLTYSVKLDTITIFEKDTSNDFAFCNCYFNFDLAVAQLPNGNHTALFYGEDRYHDTVYYGSVNFTLNLSPQGQPDGVEVSQSQSECFHITTDVEQNEVPDKFELSNAYPNPFNPSTRIKFSVGKTSFVKINVYSVAGELVDELLSRELPPGKYNIDWNAARFSSGIYFVSMTAGKYKFAQKIILMK